MRERLEANIFGIDVLREYEWNPNSYNVGGAINALISRDFAPLKDRLTSAIGRLEAIPAVVAAAKANLKNPPRVYTETAIAQNRGVINLIKGELQMFIDQAGMKTELAPAQEAAIAALTDYGKWLETDLLPRSTGEFRLGEAKYRQKLKYALSSDMSKEDLLKRAEADLRATQDKMFEVALPLYRKFNPQDESKDKEIRAKKDLIKFVLDKLAEKRPNKRNNRRASQSGFEGNYRIRPRQESRHRRRRAVKVIEMPEFARGSAVAYFRFGGTAGETERNDFHHFADAERLVGRAERIFLQRI
jgi:hypothetical protein